MKEVTKKNVGAVYETTDYDVFNVIDNAGNREIREVHVKKLMKSIKERGYIGAPIAVTKNMEIIDGQHRYEACKRLGVPIRYYIDDSLSPKDCQILNVSQSNWGMKDFVHFYATYDDNEDYQWYQSMLDTYNKLPSQVVQMVCLRRNTIGGGNAKPIKEGKLKTSKVERKRSDWELSYLNRFVEVAKMLRGREAALYSALLFCYRHPECDSERMCDIIMDNRYAIETQGTTRMYLRVFSDLYNKGKKKGKGSGRIYLAEDWLRETGQE